MCVGTALGMHAMLRFVLWRFLSLLSTLAVASIVIFVAVEIVPGDPATYMLGLNASPESVDALRNELGLDGNRVERYLRWIFGMLSGDFGVSYTYRVPVAEIIADRSAVSLPLAALAIILSTSIAVPVGFLAATHRGRPTDLGIILTTQFGVALPNFWLAMLLVLIFSIGFRWFSAGGFPGWDAGPITALKSLLLPALSLALPQAAILSRVLRSALIEALSQDYIRTARAKGLTKHQAAFRHAFPNAMIPVLTILGLQFSFLIAGAIIIENVFFLPGLGRLVFQGIAQRDLIVVESVVILLVAAVTSINFLVDIAYTLVDPRLGKN